MPQTVQTVGQNLFLGKTCPSEFWWVNTALVLHFRSTTHCWSYEQVLKLDIFFSPPRVRQRPSHRVKKIKKFYLPLLQNHHRRKPPQRRVITQIRRSKTWGFRTDCYYYTQHTANGYNTALLKSWSMCIAVQYRLSQARIFGLLLKRLSWVWDLFILLTR